jgi:hypothetical protein
VRRQLVERDLFDSGRIEENMSDLVEADPRPVSEGDPAAEREG